MINYDWQPVTADMLSFYSQPDRFTRWSGKAPLVVVYPNEWDNIGGIDSYRIDGKYVCKNPWENIEAGTIKFFALSPDKITVIEYVVPISEVPSRVEFRPNVAKAKSYNKWFGNVNIGDFIKVKSSRNSNWRKVVKISDDGTEVVNVQYSKPLDDIKFCLDIYQTNMITSIIEKS